MQLLILKEERCIHCGSQVVSESCRSHHCNGQGNEERTFKCGRVIRWSPNFERQEVVSECPKSPSEVDRLDKITKAKHKLLVVLDDADVDPVWKQRLTRLIKEGC